MKESNVFEIQTKYGIVGVASTTKEGTLIKSSSTQDFIEVPIFEAT